MSQIIFRERATPSTSPASGQMSLFSNTSGDLAWIDDNGFLTTIVTTGAATITLPNATDTVAVLGTQQTFTARPIFSTTIGVGGDTPSTSGSGITFPATQNSSSNVNTLDDYEEGNWTPTYTTTANPLSSVTYINTGAFYTKIGRTVHVHGSIRTSAVTIGSASGEVVIGNLPFPVNATADRGRATGSIGFSSAFNTNRPNQCTAENNTTYIRLEYQHSNVNSASLVPSDLLTAGNGNYLFFSAVYTT